MAYLFFDILDRYQSVMVKKKGHLLMKMSPLCPIVTNYRTFIDDLYKVLEFVEWYKEWY